MTERYWSDAGQLKRLLETTFEEILNTRMAGMPVLNPALSVQALDFRRHHQFWAGVLITPWFMNLLLLPQDAEAWRQDSPGKKISCQFPAGDFEFVVADEAFIGPYGACSLYSPMFQFERQAVALATAQAAWQALFIDSGRLTVVSGSGMSKNLSRRDLLRGRIGARKTGS